MAALVEGNAIRATVRIAGAAENTVVKLLRDLGQACSDYQDRALRNLPCRRLQVDEIWSCVYAKGKNVPQSMAPDASIGDVWTWVANDAETKLVPTFMLGGHGAGAPTTLMRGLARRLAKWGTTHLRWSCALPASRR